MSNDGDKEILKPIMRSNLTSFPNSPNNSAANLGGSSINSSLLILDPTFESSAAYIDDRSIIEKSEAIIKYYELDKEYKELTRKGSDSNAPIYTKVKCSLPEELDFSDSSDFEGSFTEEEIRHYRGVSKRDYEGRKARAKAKLESQNIVRRSRILDFLNPAFAKRVSFDTVNKTIDDPDYIDLFEETLRMNLMDEGGMGLRQGAVDPQEFTRGRRKSSYASPSLSPSRALSPGNDLPTARYHSPHRLSYGKSKIVDIDSFVITRIHRDFESLYDSKQLGASPVLPGRILMVYISGRKHTWVALDWLFRQFVENGDTIIVVATVNPVHAHFRARSGERSHSKHRRIRDRTRHKNSPEHVREVAASIMKYCLAIVDPDLVVKISVELSVGSTKTVLKDMYELYRPNLIITAAKRKMETFPAVAWRSSKIGDKLVSSYCVPIILVPAPNMDLFEFSLFAQLKLKYHEINPNEPHSAQDFQRTKLNSASLRSVMNALKLETSRTEAIFGNLSDADDEDEDNDDEGRENGDEVDDNSSIDSASSTNSNNALRRTVSGSSSLYRLRKTCEKIEKSLEFNLQTQDPTSPDYFKNLLTTVTDASREMGIHMATIEKSGGSGATLIRTITGAPNTTARYRSMLDVAEGSPVTKSRSADTSGNRSRPMSPPIPHIRIEDDASPIRPMQSSLKFDISNSSREIAQRNARKSFSGSADSLERPSLEPARSTPQMNGVNLAQASAEKDKMRKNRFSSFFKFGHKK